MRILLIDHYAGAPRYGMEFRPFYLAREWAGNGHDVTVVAASYSHYRRTQPAISRNLSEERIDAVRYLWLKTRRYAGNGIGRALNILSFVLQLLVLCPYLACRYRPDLVIASSTYPLDVFPAFCLARMRSAKLIFEVHDLWPLTPIEIGGLSRRHPFVMLMQIAEDFGYRRADWVVSLLPCAAAYMRSHGLSQERFVHIPNGVNVDEWNSPKESLSDLHAAAVGRLRRENRFIVAYLGAHGRANALDSVVRAAELLRDEPVAFVLVGYGPEKDRLQRLCSDRGLKSVVFLPAVPKAAIPALLERVDSAFLLWRRSPLYRFGISPNKLMDYMMAGKPVIQAIEAGNDMVSDSQCGFSIPPEDPRAFADAVRRLMRLSDVERSAMGERGRLYVTTNHDYRNLARRFPGIACPESDNQPGPGPEASFLAADRVFGGTGDTTS